ncbi:putative glycosyl transferase [Legionella birminghamensis]|uniref:Glycosyl transferase n=1 Tax=Legionella birminghamensis TaxID=28083 RepID=A0A378I960_9GAMM|nr:glycosyltransferase family 1 protein [Legionella birminghamensis]KTC69438.1 putative glycosyl transferase [Legionella birminghamensis]STX31679.1 putative glycosyl transferase [Legionella birminghamensis]
MKVIIDVTRLMRRTAKRQTITGIDRVTMAFVSHYAEKAQALVRWGGRSWVLPQAQSQALFKWLDSRGSKVQLARYILSGILLRRKINEKTVLLNTGHVGLGQSDYQRIIKKQGAKSVFIVHDTIPVTYPEYCSPGEDQRYHEKMSSILSLASAIITNSQATLNDLSSYLDQKNHALPPCKVILLGSGIPAAIKPGLRPMQKPYFVMLSTIEPRKNHLLMLQIWRQLVEEMGEAAPHLVVIGKRGWECENVIDILERCQVLKNYITELSQCSDADLVNYLHHSQALLFPSFSEGFGLPLIEALSLKVPVIASDLPVFKEIAGDIPEYINPLDGRRWKELICEYADSKSLRRTQQVERISSFNYPTWSDYFRQVDLLLNEL